MNKKILLTTTTNNGYGCGCCMRTSDFTDWIDPSDILTVKETIQRALRVNPYSDYGDTIFFLYEDNGIELYGFDVSVSKNEFSIDFFVGDKRYKLDSTGKKGLTEEELFAQIMEDFKNDDVIGGYLK